MDNIIQIKCDVKDTLTLEDIKDFQGNLKKRTQKDINKIKNSISTLGFTFPFFIWKDKDVNKCLDGHGRLQALKQMQNEGYIVPPLPIVYVEAKDEEQAKIKLLHLNSQYGVIDELGLQEFIKDFNIDLQDFELNVNETSITGLATQRDEKIEYVTFGKEKIPITEKEKETLEKYLTEYKTMADSNAGFISHLLQISNELGKAFFFEGNITKIKGADYNPRAIDSDKIELLKQSIKTIGMTRPIIVNKANNIIIAGHQRVKALTALGIKKAPIVEICISNEMEHRINQLHNAIEQTDTSRMAKVPPQIKTGFFDIRVIDSKIIVNSKVYNYINILLKYGDIDSAVASLDGEVIKGFDYLIACKILHCPARVYYIENEKKELAKQYLFKDYGKFDYQNKNTISYQQCKAQMKRLSKIEGNKQNISTLYTLLQKTENLKGKKILDFGCGRGDYVYKLKSQGIDIIGIEFFRNVKGKIDYRWTDEVVQEICEKIKNYGLFDIVICDSVLNSVISLETQDDVLNCLSAFCKVSGKVYFSGRCIDEPLRYLDETKTRRTKGTMHQLDDNGFSATFVSGQWYYQKFHSKSEIITLVNNHNFTLQKLYYDKKTWQVESIKAKDLSKEKLIASITREFNLQYSPNRHYDNAKYVLQALKLK